eukprot:4357877-Prymnesium_polylepis.2
MAVPAGRLNGEAAHAGGVLQQQRQRWVCDDCEPVAVNVRTSGAADRSPRARAGGRGPWGPAAGRL